MKTHQAGYESHNKIQRNYYENRSSEENWRMQPVSTPYVNAHVQKLIDAAKFKTDDKVLDIGCGMGKFTIPLAKRGYSIEGLDLSPVLLETLSNHCAEEVSIPTHCADILKPPSSLNDQYDSVVGFFMLHHLPDIGIAFKKIHGLLKNNGRVAFVDVNPWCPFYCLQITLSPAMSWKAERGIFNLTRKKIVSNMSAAGFSDIKIERYGILPPFLKNRGVLNFADDAFTRQPWLRPMAAFQLIHANR